MFLVSVVSGKKNDNKNNHNKNKHVLLLKNQNELNETTEKTIKGHHFQKNHKTFFSFFPKLKGERNITPGMREVEKKKQSQAISKKK